MEITRPSLSPISPGRSSYVLYPMSQSAANSDRFEMRLRFQTSDMDQIALLAFVGQRGRHDARSQHLALTFVKGYVMLTWNMGAGEISLSHNFFLLAALLVYPAGSTLKLAFVCY